MNGLIDKLTNKTMQCSKCQKEMKLVAAGTSKRTGKPYNAFYSCDRECGTTAKADQVYTPPEKAPEDEVLEMVARIENIETLLIGKGVNIEEIKTAIGNLALAVDGLKEELNKRIDGIGKWIENNVK